MPDYVAESLLKKVARCANLRNNGPHILRHTFCSHLAMRGAPARAIQELAGHRDLGTTQRYMHLSPAAKEIAIRLLEPPGFGDILETADPAREKMNGWKQLSGEPRRNRTFNPQIKSRFKPISRLTRILSQTRAISLSFSGLASIYRCRNRRQRTAKNRSRRDQIGLSSHHVYGTPAE